MQELIKEYRDAQDHANTLLKKLKNTSDGFIYLACVRCYGSIQWITYNNEFLTQELCDDYNGDDGIVDIYTNNPNTTINSYGDVEIKSLEELQNISQDDTSMSRAITNWIAKSY
jgi:hypothetical protein